ncbi:Hypothetical_protein [Hexamita inflata]|uniref:Hypothetical_protein n=1 Tax=Hexamita inflata TaxID=28002 RepID=A0AA86RH55_9EUKA|nr:Hypothetical protein HINF_LOCUS62323 [Hexamita inflata]
MFQTHYQLEQFNYLNIKTIEDNIQINYQNNKKYLYYQIKLVQTHSSDDRSKTNQIQVLNQRNQYQVKTTTLHEAEICQIERAEELFGIQKLFSKIEMLEKWYAEAYGDISNI